MPSDDFAFDDTIFFASYVINKRADFFGARQHVAFLSGKEHSAITENIVRCRSATQQPAGIGRLLLYARAVDASGGSLFDHLIAAARAAQRPILF